MAESNGSPASELLLARKDEIATATTTLLYQRQPRLLEKYGDRGRAKCLQDMRYTVEHLTPAVAMDDPQLFVQYVRWLVNMLAPRNIPADDVHDSLVAMRDVLALLEPAHRAAFDACMTPAIALFTEDAPR